MARYSAKAPINFELPAPVCVYALLVAGALTKGDHPQWAIGATIFLYVLHLAAQCLKRGTSSAHRLTVVDSIMMKMRASAVGLTTAATIAAATVLLSGAVLAHSHLAHFGKAETELAHRTSSVAPATMGPAWSLAETAANGPVENRSGAAGGMCSRPA
jgi:hypothetical protein